jgi:hypothetical protein
MWRVAALNPNEIILSVKGRKDFPTAMPVELNGLIAPADHAASIRRINVKKRLGPVAYLGVLFHLGGFALLVVMMALMSSGLSWDVFIGGMFGGIGSIILGTGIGALEGRRRMRITQAQSGRGTDAA